ncbi:hypothetical protein GCM10010329_41310 [Streptomyces spiroverticillatus]|uniref:Secreted protein n=1 Tax=Streptomyces finlayi TaxID=67296 RepID=A0A918WZG5_9ACTN|nr:hypothetical protein [Streptomyces finlayi]GHA14163.1 hypothetical protein GCM10010329_41310 [Streptomyces spiroverticillatus]GHC97490.1 hypothetical protein GCM10010334_38930 [Streptomyces finlayi]
MRTTRVVSGALLAALAVLGAAPAAGADETPSPSPSAGESAAPTEAGTSFRTATAVKSGQLATAGASTGDYLYWVFPADAGQDATVRAKVALPESAQRHGAQTWQLDVYDGLRRKQACTYGSSTATAPKEATSVSLACHLRTVRSWAEQSSNDPLPGSYFVRLTVTSLADDDLGLPVKAEVQPAVVDAGGSKAVDGALTAPLVPGATTVQDDAKGEPRQISVQASPEGGWASGTWSSRWLWTAGGAVLAALAGVAGYAMTRGSGRPARVPQGY